MSELPPPPENFSNPDPVPESPGAPVVVHESDVLRRRGRFSWRSFGGDGFLFSVVFHVILAVLAIFWVVSQLPGAKTADPEQTVFDTGKGGGNKGEIPTQTPVAIPVSSSAKTLPKLVANGPSGITLPEMPANSSPLSSTLASNGIQSAISSGTGGGAGGGHGLGIGAGRGGRGNFVSLFGGKYLTNGLVGTYYDLKYAREVVGNGKLQPSDIWRNPPTWHSGDNIGYTTAFPELSGNKTLDAERYYKTIDSITRSGKKTEEILEKYFVSPTKLYSSQMWIPSTPSATSPKAFEVGGKCAAHFWIVSYKGKVSPPSNGKWRFIGSGDDVMIVKINNKPTLAWYWWMGRSFMRQIWDGAPSGSEPADTSKVRAYTDASGRAPSYGEVGGMGVGEWISMNKGTWYDIEVLIADWGGAFQGFLLCEKEGETYESTRNGLTKAYLFRTSEEMKADPAPWTPVFMPDSPVWACKAPPVSKGPR